MTSTPWRSLVLVAAVVALQVLRASPAPAHEFTLVLVEADVGTAAAAGPGFRLAVEQSPDVSHPPGEDAGDHLGGVDVNIVSVNARSPSLIEDVDGLLASGAGALVVLTSGADAEAVIASAVARRRVVVAIDEGDWTEGAPAHIRLRADERADGSRFDEFAGAYDTASGSPPTEAATLGYDAGKLLDAVVSDLGEHLEPGPALAEAAIAAANHLVVAEVDLGPPSSTPTGDAASDAAPPSRRRAVALVAAATSSGLLVVGGGVVVSRRRRRWLAT